MLNKITLMDTHHTKLHNSGLLLFLCAAHILFSSCIRTIAPTEPLLPKLDDPRSYVKHILDNSTCCTYLSGFANIRVTSPENRISTKNIFFIKQPCFLRFETLGPFNQLAAIVTADNETLIVYMPREGGYYKGAATPENLYSLIGVYVTPERIASAGIGRVPTIPLDRSVVEYGQDAERYIVVITSPGSISHTLWIDPEEKHIVRYLQSRNQVPVFEQTHKKYIKIEEKSLPTDIVLIMHRYNTRAHISFENLNTTPVPDSAFIISAPENISAQPLTSLTTR